MNLAGGVQEECSSSRRSNFSLIFQPCGEIEYLMFLLIAFIQPLFLPCFALIPSNTQVSFWCTATRRLVKRQQSRYHFLIGLHTNDFYAMGILKTMFTGGMLYQKLKYKLEFLFRINHIPFLILLQMGKKSKMSDLFTLGLAIAVRMMAQHVNMPFSAYFNLALRLFSDTSSSWGFFAQEQLLFKQKDHQQRGKSEGSHPCATGD